MTKMTFCFKIYLGNNKIVIITIFNIFITKLAYDGILFSFLSPFIFTLIYFFIIYNKINNFIIGNPQFFKTSKPSILLIPSSLLTTYIIIG